MQMEKKIKVIISGGGTADIFSRLYPLQMRLRNNTPTLKFFVGAEGRMEMQRVPEAGYKIIGLPVAGFDRKHLLKNISVLIKLG